MNCCQIQCVEKVYSCSHKVDIQDICEKFPNSTRSLSFLRDNLSVHEYTRILDSIQSDSMETIRPCPQIEENQIYVRFCESRCSEEFGDFDSVVEKDADTISVASAIEEELKCENLEYEEIILKKSESFIDKIVDDVIENVEESEKSPSETPSLYRSSREFVVRCMKSNDFLNATILVLTLSILAFYTINKFIN